MSMCINETMYLDILINNKIKNNNNNDSSYLDDKSFIDIMRKLKFNIELVSELNFLKDYRNDISKLIKSEDFLYNNLILNLDEICKISDNKDVIEVFKFFDSQSLCVVVEPNKNMYLSLDYSKIVSKLKKYVSAEAINALLLHDKVQRFAFVNLKNELLLDNINKLKQEVIISCDFEKKPIIFEYSCEAIDAIDTGLRFHSKFNIYEKG